MESNGRMSQKFLRCSFKACTGSGVLKQGSRDASHYMDVTSMFVKVFRSVLSMARIEAFSFLLTYLLM